MNVLKIERGKKCCASQEGAQSLNTQLTFQTERVQEKAAASTLIRVLVAIVRMLPAL